MYGGGFGELGVGRHQIQYLASLFHPNTPNDVAPSGYNLPKLEPTLPTSRSPRCRPTPAFAGPELGGTAAASGSARVCLVRTTNAGGLVREIAVTWSACLS